VLVDEMYAACGRFWHVSFHIAQCIRYFHKGDTTGSYSSTIVSIVASI